MLLLLEAQPLVSAEAGASSADIGVQSALEGPDAPSRKASGCTFMVEETHKEDYLNSWGVTPAVLCPLAHKCESPESI